MKAYVVECPNDPEGRSVVVFAPTNGAAKRRALDDGGTGADDFTDLRARRAPLFDGLSHEDLIRAQLECGWWFGCSSWVCRKEVRHDDEADVQRYVIRDGSLFCTSVCCITELRRRETELRGKWDAIARTVEAIPGVEVFGAFKNAAGEWLVQMCRPENDFHTTEYVP